MNRLGRENKFISSMIDTFKRQFPDANFKYQLVNGTHILRTYLDQNQGGEEFQDFCLNMYHEFFIGDFDNILCITDEATLVELNSPSNFSWNMGVDMIQPVQSENIVVDAESIQLITAA